MFLCFCLLKISSWGDSVIAVKNQALSILMLRLHHSSVMLLPAGFGVSCFYSDFVQLHTKAMAASQHDTSSISEIKLDYPAPRTRLQGSLTSQTKSIIICLCLPLNNWVRTSFVCLRNCLSILEIYVHILTGI